MIRNYIGWLMIIGSFIPFGIAVYLPFSSEGDQYHHLAVGLYLSSQIIFYLGILLVGKQVYQKYRKKLFKHSIIRKDEA